MKSFKRTVFILSACCLWLSLGMIATSGAIAQEYHREVFLRLPGARVVEQGFLHGPTGIGVDFDDNLCIFFSKILTFYNDEGDTIRQLQLEYGHDFCFDEYGNIFTLKNNGGEVTIRKYDRDGHQLGTMTNDFDLVHSLDRRQLFEGRYISYIRDVGLYMHSEWRYIPINFIDGKIPDFTFADRVVNGRLLAKGTWIIKKNISERNVDVITIHHDNTSEKTLRFEGNRWIAVESIYSLDLKHQYYVTATPCIDSKNLKTNILKYDDDELIFSTEVILRNRIDYFKGKNYVVDSKGNIYFYAGNEDEIQIIRWVLK